MKHPHLHTLSFRLSAIAPDGQSAPTPGPLRFEGVAYSGGVVPAYGWRGDVAIDLSGLQNPDGDELPVLIDHDARIEAIAGRGRIFKFTQPDGITGLRIAGELTEATEAGQQIASLMREGYPLQMSLGLQANFREMTEPVTLNGHELKVAGVFEQPRIREVSFVQVGADPATSAAAVRFAFDPVSQPSPAKEPATMSRTAEDEALIAGLQEQVKSLQAELQKARQERRAEQLAALPALMTGIGESAGGPGGMAKGTQTARRTRDPGDDAGGQTHEMIRSVSGWGRGGLALSRPAWPAARPAPESPSASCRGRGRTRPRASAAGAAG